MRAYDALVIGAGPAGLATSAALSRRRPRDHDLTHDAGEKEDGEHPEVDAVARRILHARNISCRTLTSFGTAALQQGDHPQSSRRPPDPRSSARLSARGRTRAH